MPAAARLDIWSIDWRHLSPGQTAALTALLTAEEAARAARYHRPEDRARSTLGRGLLRWLSARALGCSPEILTLKTEARGKPFWADPPSMLEVNISHSGDWIMLALSTGAPVGIDVQEQRANVDMIGVARLSMHPEEHAELAREGNPPALFYTLWSLREAALKATGDGFFAKGTDLNCLPLPQPDRWSYRRFGPDRAVQLRPLPAAPGYAAAMACVAGSAPPPEPAFFSRADLPGEISA